MLGLLLFRTIIFLLVWKALEFSTNNGIDWTDVNEGLTNKYVTCFAMADNNLFAGFYYGGFYLCTNNGTSWTAVNNGPTDLSINTLAVSGTNLLSGASNGNVFLSTNNGST